MNQPNQSISKLTFRTPVLERVSSKHGRLYKLPDGRMVPGVTTVLEIISKPALQFWAASEERKHCVENAAITFQEVMDSDLVTTEDGTVQHELTPQFKDILVTRLGSSFACVRKTRTAADIGSEAHAAIEWWIKEKLGQSVGPFPVLSDGAQIAFMAFEDWAKSVDFEPLAAEVMIYDPWHGYAGTFDWVARIKSVLTLGDNKTGKKIYPESFLQGAAYISALRKQCRLGDEPIQGAVVRFPKVLEDITEHPFEVKTLTAQDQKINFIAFCKALDLWRWSHPDAGKSLPNPANKRPPAKSVAVAGVASQRWTPPVKAPTAPIATKPAPTPKPPEPTPTPPPSLGVVPAPWKRPVVGRPANQPGR